MAGAGECWCGQRPLWGESLTRIYSDSCIFHVRTAHIKSHLQMGGSCDMQFSISTTLFYKKKKKKNPKFSKAVALVSFLLSPWDLLLTATCKMVGLCDRHNTSVKNHPIKPESLCLFICWITHSSYVLDDTRKPGLEQGARFSPGGCVHTRMDARFSPGSQVLTRKPQSHRFS